MAKELLLRRGTTAENNLFVGALGEPSYDTQRKELRIHDGSTVGGKIVSAPTGMIAPFGSSTAPEGWLICDGSAVSRTDYADLFAVIGTTYGDGDGSATFNLPNAVIPLEILNSNLAVIAKKGYVGVNGTWRFISPLTANEGSGSGENLVAGVTSTTTTASDIYAEVPNLLTATAIIKY